MGTPVKIVDMAKDLIRLSGKEPDKDIKIVFTGLRDGEKLNEELITVGEGIVPTDHEKIMVLRSNGFSHGLKGPADVAGMAKCRTATLVRCCASSRFTRDKRKNFMRLFLSMFPTKRTASFKNNDFFS